MSSSSPLKPPFTPITSPRQTSLLPAGFKVRPVMDRALKDSNGTEPSYDEEEEHDPGSLTIRLSATSSQGARYADDLESDEEIAHLYERLESVLGDFSRYKKAAKDEIHALNEKLALQQPLGTTLGDFVRYKKVATDQIRALNTKACPAFRWHAQDRLQEIEAVNASKQALQTQLGRVQLQAQRQARETKKDLSEALMQAVALKGELAVTRDLLDEITLTATTKVYRNNPAGLTYPVNTRTREILREKAISLPTASRSMGLNRFTKLEIGDEGECNAFFAAWPFISPVLVVRGDAAPCNEDKTILLGHCPTTVYSYEKECFVENPFPANATKQYEVVIASEDERSYAYAGCYSLTSLAGMIPGGFPIPNDICSKTIHELMGLGVHLSGNPAYHPGAFALAVPEYKAGRPWVHAFSLNFASYNWGKVGRVVMWERTLQDLIRGLRANKKDESKFIAKAVDEIRKEIKSDDMELKAGAVLKLTYLDMLGYDMKWASFNVVEVMSSPRFHLKSVGYLAAVQSFDQETDVLMLTTNLLKKDLTSNPTDIAVTLNGLSHIVTPDLARDLSSELMTMLTHSRAHIRKRAILALYKVMVRYPEALGPGIARLREKLDDPDPGVIASTVNVLCELARKSPEDYLPLAPQLFHLLTTSRNNWMLIKIIKLFGSLSPHEPRLVKKLQQPITELISTTPAISLLYECVHTCIIGGMLQGSSGDSLARLCVSKLAAFIEDSDQNLKYIALLALVKIVPTHPYLVADYQDTILASVNDQDISIRMRALDLVSAMVTAHNLQSIVQQILSHLVTDASSTPLPTAAQSLAQNAESFAARVSPSQSPAYRLTLAQRILNICSRSLYENVSNFEWYLSVLVDLAHVANVDIGAQIRDQLVDVVGRVKGVRRYAVKLMYTLLCDDTILHNARDEGSCSEVLWAAAWICGEYCSELAEPQKLLPYLLQPQVATLHPEIIAVYIQATSKIFGHWAAETAERWDDDDLAEVKSAVNLILTQVREFVSNTDVEVQERAANTLQLFNFINADLAAFKPRPAGSANNPFAEASSSFDPVAEPRFPKSLYLIQPLHTAYELNPVAILAQASVPVPPGLDLDVWFIPPPPEPTVEAPRKSKGKSREVNGGGGKSSSGKSKKKQKEVVANGDAVVLTPANEEAETPEQAAERDRRLAERRERQREDPYYIIDDRPTATAAASSSRQTRDDIDSIPVVRLDDMPSLSSIDDSRTLPSLRADPYPAPAPVSYTIDRDGEMPEGAVTPPPPPPHSTTNNNSASSTPARSGTPSSRIVSFPEYEVPDADVRTSTPEPIKVVRTKKKTPGKKKRTQTGTSTPLSESISSTPP
ncbi:AP-3 complex subunit delta [Mycena kentingensis (nom. inval.)]|nr:AP-3 complex subunit delta [Mycena kentingensis (nom. inval.)]